MLRCAKIWPCCTFSHGRSARNDMYLMRHWSGWHLCVFVCACVLLCRWRWLDEGASCFVFFSLQRADGSVSRPLWSQSCPTLLLTPHLTADFLPAHHRLAKTHTHTIKGRRKQCELIDHRDWHEGRKECKSGGGIQINTFTRGTR